MHVLEPAVAVDAGETPTPFAVHSPGANSKRPSTSWGLSQGAFKALLVMGDLVAILLAFMLLDWALGHAPVPSFGAAVFVLAQVVGLYLVESYEPRTYQEFVGLPLRILIAAGIAAFIAGVTAFLLPRVGLTRSVASGYFLFSLPLLMIWRTGGANLVRRTLRPRRVAVVGSGPAAWELVKAFTQNRGFELTSVVTNGGDRVVVEVPGMQRAEVSLPGLADILHTQEVNLVAVALPEKDRQELLHALVACRYRGIEVQDIATCIEMLESRLPVAYMEDNWVAFSSRFLGWGHDFEDKFKRMLDVSISLVVLIVALIPMGIIGLLIRLTSPGSALFRQARVGRRGAVFTLFKFRSMHVDSETDGAVWAVEDDPRTTTFGRFLRRSHLDELPQLLNVLRGDMSLVGPRPERPEFVEELRQTIPYYDLRHIVKPGVTGWAQVSFPYGASVEDAQAKLEYDLYYLRHKNVLWDLRILLQTVAVSAVGRGSR